MLIVRSLVAATPGCVVVVMLDALLAVLSSAGVLATVAVLLVGFVLLVFAFIGRFPAHQCNFCHREWRAARAGIE